MRLHVRELRAGAEPKRVPLVLLHGWLGCGDDFTALADADALRDRTVLAVDLPGHGESPDYDREYDFAEVAAWLNAAIEPDVVDLCGYSMGGRVARYFAATHRARVASLTLIGAHPGLRHPVEQRERLEQDAERATQLLTGSEAFLTQWVMLPLFGARDSEAWEAVQSRRRDEVATHAYAWARALLCLSTGRQMPLWHLSDSLRLPTLLLAGEADAKYRALNEAVGSENPTYSRAAVVAEAAHAVHLDAPDATARAIAEFLPKYQEQP